MRFEIPEKIDLVLKTLEDAGYEAYIVGGCVRDMLCRKRPDDYDVTTNALPRQVKSLFAKTVDTGIKHGTVTVMLDGTPIEVTTYRTEGSYTDSRRPDSVEFVGNVKDDLARRDFTVNAMCYNPRRGIVDHFGGKEDIKNMCLRAVGEPERRFAEDALRILRLFRFSATLGFSIEENTLRAAIKCADELKNISRERIATELIKTACGVKVEAITPLLECGALEFLGLYSTDETKRINLLPPKTELRLTAFIKLCGGDPERVTRELKLSNSIKRYALIMQKLDESGVPNSRREIKDALDLAGFEYLLDRFEYMRVINGIDTALHEQTLYDILRKGEPYSVSQLAINGKELLSLGLKGEDVGLALKKLRDAVADDPSLNTFEKLSEIIGN